MERQYKNQGRNWNDPWLAEMNAQLKAWKSLEAFFRERTQGKQIMVFYSYKNGKVTAKFFEKCD